MNIMDTNCEISKKNVSDSTNYVSKSILQVKRLFTFIILMFAPVISADFFLNGFFIKGWLSLFLFVIVLGILNAYIWPLVSKLAFSFILFTLGFGTLILNGIFIMVASYLIGGVTIATIWEGTLVVIVITMANLILNLIMSADDDYAYYRYVVNRTDRKSSGDKARIKKLKKMKPGILFIEIDGLAEPIMRKAIENGKMPTLKSWLENKNYKLVHWVTELASQTSASQAGILLGNNRNIPAFRWVDRKDNYRVVTSSNPSDTPKIESTLSNGNGLLVDKGASRVNMYSGDAEDTLFTLSKINEFRNVYNGVLITYFSHPYNFARTFILFLFEIFLEYKNRVIQKTKKIEPRLGREKRGGIYPFVRASMTVFMRDLNTYALVNDIYNGKHNAIYATYASYDEVAHHSGIEDNDAYKTLRKLDKQFRRLELAIKESPRKYNIVLLSDHGQTGGKTFKQRYNMTLGDYVRKVLKDKFIVTGYLSNDEGVSNVKAMLSTMVREDSLVYKKFNHALDKLESNNISVVGGSDIKKTSRFSQKLKNRLNSKVIVLASGNLGLIYFKGFNQRITLETVDEKAPGFVKELSSHEGIGFIMLKNENGEAIIISDNKRCNLTRNDKECGSVLKEYGKYAIESLKRVHTFDNCPDILVNSFYDPQNNEGSAFEELIGFHGGLGGTQNLGFVMYPADVYEFPDKEVYGAESLYHIFKQWENSTLR